MTMKIGNFCGFEELDSELYFWWKIPNFFSLPKNADAFYESPSFEFESTTWCLRLFPNGPKKSEPSGWIGLFLRKQKSELRNQIVSFNLSILNEKGCDYIQKRVNEHAFVGNDIDWGWFKFLERSELLNKKTVLPLDEVNITCRISYKNVVEETTQKHTTSITPSTSSALAGLGTKNLICNLKDLFLKQKNSDITIRVKDQEFRAHRLILEARCPVFAAMFEHDVTESRSGVVEITDADPDDFREFLLYIYSGEVEHFSTENVCQLYVLADKYDIDDLKEECVNFIEKSLSAETVCEIIHIADTYDDIRMKNFSKDFIRKNRCDVLATAKWKEFETENQPLAYETIKTLYLEQYSEE